ncbi:MAG: hypothetical protein QW084_04790, partial [Candidatus Hadarchaeales archaeon]
MEVRTVSCERAQRRDSPPAGRGEAPLSLLLSLLLLFSSLSPVLAEDWYELESWTGEGEGTAGWSALESWEGGVRTLGPPQLLYPPHASFLPTATPTLDWSDVEGATSYQLLVDNDPSFTSPEVNVFPTSSEYAVPSPGLSDGVWHWRVRAKAGALSSPWSEVRSFTVDTVFPPSPSLFLPGEGENLLEDQPLFLWSSVWDSSGVSYILEIDNDPDFGSPLYRKAGLTENQHRLENKLCENFSPYRWRVCAVDGAGNENWSQPYTFTLKVFPSSLVQPLSPYWQTSSPISVTVTASDNDGTVENVELWYRWSPDNSSWSSWILYDNLSTSPYTFSFVPPSGQGHYQFYSRAWDDRGNYEQAPPGAEAEVGYDNTPPATPSPSLPENGATVETPTPTLGWSGVEDVSGVTYELEVYENQNLNLLYHLLLAENVYPLENALESGSYRWRVKARDGAGWESGWSENYYFTVRLWWGLESWWTGSAGQGFWREVEGWTGTVVAPHVWKELEEWGGSCSTRGGWERVEEWVIFTTSPGVWHVLEGYAVFLPSSVCWCKLEGFGSAVVTQPLWRGVEGWQGGVGGITGAWRETERWSASFQVFQGSWLPSDSWSCASSSPVPRPSPISPKDGYNTQTSPTLEWENLQPADNFHVQVDNDPAFPSPKAEGWTSSTSFAPGPLQDNLYYWRVRMFRSGENSPWSEVRTFRVDTVPPAKPQLLSPLPGENENDSTPLLTWQAPPENSLPLTYYVEVSTSKYFEPESVVENVWVSSTSYETSFKEDGIWWWRVLARDNAGNTGLFSEARNFRVDTLPPLVPSLIQPENGGWRSSSPTFAWQSVEENSKPVLYRFFLAYDEGFNLKVEDLWTASTSLSFLLPEGTYWWRVGARDNAGNWSGWSGGRWFRIDNTPPSKVTLLHPENEGCVGQQVELEWENATDEGAGVRWYEAEVDTDPGFSSPEWRENSAENRSSILLEPGEYCWRVRAWDNAWNPGEWSGVRWFRVCRWEALVGWSVGAGYFPGWYPL